MKWNADTNMKVLMDFNKCARNWYTPTLISTPPMCKIDYGKKNHWIYTWILAYWLKGHKLKPWYLKFHHPVETYFVINRYILLDLGHFVSFALVLYKLGLDSVFARLFLLI